MPKMELEPGLLQVFRLCVWIHLVSAAMMPLTVIMGKVRPDRLPEAWIAFAYMVIFSLILLAMLYEPWFQDHLGRLFFPLTLAISAGGIIVEQGLLLVRSIHWQVYPLLTILLILVAWQYSYRQVAIFTLSIGALQFMLSQLTQWPLFLRAPFLLDSERATSYVFLIASLASFLVVGYVVNRLAIAQREQRRALADVNQKLISHATTLEQLATSRERIHLSRELHDTLAHTLSAQAVQIEALLTFRDALPGKARSMLEQMLDSTRSGLDETRRVLSALRASPLDEMGLSAAVRTYVEDFAARHNLSLALDIHDHLDDLPPEVELCFYRVTQEALENIARHADAKTLRVSVDQHNNSLCLEIADDGKGFYPQQDFDDQQLGIKGMRERADMIGAVITIQSRPGEGTAVQLKWERMP